MRPLPGALQSPPRPLYVPAPGRPVVPVEGIRRLGNVDNATRRETWKSKLADQAKRSVAGGERSEPRFINKKLWHTLRFSLSPGLASSPRPVIRGKLISVMEKEK